MLNDALYNQRDEMKNKMNEVYAKIYGISLHPNKNIEKPLWAKSAFPQVDASPPFGLNPTLMVTQFRVYRLRQSMRRYFRYLQRPE
ncbi:MAG: hypothetical protein ACTILG_01775 [Sphingobacterium sp.]